MSKAANKLPTKAEEKANLPVVHDYGDYSGAGFEGTTREDFAIPFLAVMQSNSPLVTAEDSEFRAGMIYNTATEAGIKGSEGIDFIPVARERKFVEWIPREKGGGIAEVYDPEDPFVEKTLAANPGYGKKPLPNGNELVDTYYLYGIILGDSGSMDPAMIAFSSTKIQPYKSLMTKAKGAMLTTTGGRKVRPPLFGLLYHLSTVKQKNTKGEFYNWKIDFAKKTVAESALPPRSDEFLAAAALYEAHRSGGIKTDLKQQSAEGGADNGASDGGAVVDGDIPF